MRVRAGTSGYSFKEWKGSFYPQELGAGEMLHYYACRLDTVEINNTFYRMPTEKMLRDWSAQVPDRFSFVLKASRRITHQKRLADAGDTLSYLLQHLGVLGEKLGPLLFQLPPFLKKDLKTLESFLALLPQGLRAAFEFRHASWFDGDVYAALRARNLALVVADGGAAEGTPIEPTASYGYLRLRAEHYSDEALASWARRVLAQPWEEAHVFFKHEADGTGPRWAARFSELAAVRA